MATVAFLTSAGICCQETGVRSTSDWTKPRRVPSAAYTCEEPTPRIGCSELIFEAESATFRTYATAAIVPMIAAPTARRAPRARCPPPRGGHARRRRGSAPLAPARRGGGPGRGCGVGVRPRAPRAHPAAHDAWIRLARRPACRTRRPLGRLVVPGHRQVRLPSRPRRFHLPARGVLPRIPAGPAAAHVDWRASGARRNAAVAGGARACAVR